MVLPRPAPATPVPRRLRWLAPALLAAAGPAALATTTWHLTDLTPGGHVDACAWGLDDHGLAVGYVADDAAGTRRVAMAWAGGRSARLGPGYAKAVANDGTIVGNENPGSPRGAQAFVVRDGRRQPLDPRPGPHQDTVRAVARAGACGWDTEAGLTQATLVTPDRQVVTFVLPEPTSWSGCMGLASNGLATGMANFTQRGNHTLGFVGRPGAWTILTNGDSDMVTPFAVNAAGTVTGHYAAPGFETRGFLYRDGVMSDLPRFTGSQTYGLAINDAGQVAGSSVGDRVTAVLVEPDGTLVDLTARLDPAQPGWVVDTGAAIDRHGAVAGCGYRVGEPGRHAVVLTPMD